MVLVPQLDREEVLWMQVTNAVKGTLSSPSCKNPYGDRVKILRRFVVWIICHELYFCVDYWNSFQNLGNIYYIKSQESHTLVVNVMLIGVLESTMAQFPFIIIYVQVLTKLSVNLSLCA
jgi:hypothetical protein